MRAYGLALTCLSLTTTLPQASDQQVDEFQQLSRNTRCRKDVEEPFSVLQLHASLSPGSRDIGDAIVNKKDQRIQQNRKAPKPPRKGKVDAQDLAEKSVTWRASVFEWASRHEAGLETFAVFAVTPIFACWYMWPRKEEEKEPQLGAKNEVPHRLYLKREDGFDVKEQVAKQLKALEELDIVRLTVQETFFTDLPEDEILECSYDAHENKDFVEQLESILKKKPGELPDVIRTEGIIVRDKDKKDIVVGEGLLRKNAPDRKHLKNLNEECYPLYAVQEHHGVSLSQFLPTLGACLCKGELRAKDELPSKVRELNQELHKSVPDSVYQQILKENQAFDVLLSYMIDAQQLFSECAIVVFDFACGFVLIYRGATYLNKSRKSQQENLLLMMYMAIDENEKEDKRKGFYKALVAKSSRPTLEKVMEKLLKHEVRFEVTEG